MSTRPAREPLEDAPRAWWRGRIGAVLIVAAALSIVVTACGGDHAVVFRDITTNTTAGVSSETPDTTVVSGPRLGPWVDVTANLAGLVSECDNLSYVTGRSGGPEVFAGVARQGLWSLDPAGTAWAKLGVESEVQITNRTTAIVFDPTVPERFWETGSFTGPGAVVTTDGGRTFNGFGGLGHLDGLSIDFAVSGGQTMLAGRHQDHILYRSTDGGLTWTDIGPSIPGTSFTGQPLVLAPDLFLVGETDPQDGTGATIVRSVDGGATWQAVQAGGVAGPALVAADGSIYWPLQDGGLVRSTDRGATWSRVTRPGTLASYTIVQLADGRLASLAARFAVVSDDQGRTWRPLGPALPTTDARGLAYSEARNAVFVWSADCQTTVPPGSVQRLDLTPVGS